MEECQRPSRYRGYRPLPLWWFKLKYLGGMLAFGIAIAFASVQLIVALLTGEVADFSNESVSFLSPDSPWWFAWYLLLWTGMDLLFIGGALLFFSRWKGLDGPSAETRL